MIDKRFLHEVALKLETGFDNILREYAQHLFLRFFYTKKGSENFLFKGGTSLRIVFGSPRFSEDLDFTGLSNSEKYEKVLEASLQDMYSEGMEVKLHESKATSGGHLAHIEVSIFGEHVKIQNHISFRSRSETLSENVVVISNVTPTYNVYILDRKIIVKEKIEALIDRSKPRDFFDLYFLLRNQNLRRYINLDKLKTDEIIFSLKKHSKEELDRELKRFLPKSYLEAVKDLPSAILREL